MSSLVVTLRGHLTVSALERELAPIERQLGDGPHPVIVDASAMSGYEEDARSRFVDWSRRHRDRIAGIAIVTDRLMWRMVISAMSVASTQEMRAFDSLDAARAWTERDGQAGEPNQAQIVVGRLMEVRVRSQAASEITRLAREIAAARSLKVPEGGVVTIADLRLLSSLSPLFVERATKLLSTWNTGVVRAVFLLPQRAGAMGLQLQRILAAAGNPNRRLFYDPSEAEAWLAEVLTPEERERLAAFLQQT